MSATDFDVFGGSATPKSLKKLPFTSSERELIVALVRERPIIEDKRTHAKNIELKKQAWEELTVAFNSQPYVTKRNNVQLKRCWENIKTQRKKELSQESMSMIRTGGGPPQGGSATSSDNVVDVICPFINLTIPEVIDSNTIEIKEKQKNNDLKKIDQNMVKLDGKDADVIVIDKKRKLDTEFDESQECTEVINLQDQGNENIPCLQPKKRICKDIGTIETSNKKFTSEIEVRIKRCSINIQQDQALHELRMQRERILIERETNILNFEKEMHDLQKEKIRLEIEILKKKIEN